MLHDVTVQQMTKMLRNLSAMLDKATAFAESKKFDPNVFVTTRLAPDMLPFSRQIQIACDTARLGAYRLAGRDPGSFTDDEKTIAELKTRIERTISALSEISAADLAKPESREIALPWWGGKALGGYDYAMQHVIPNFYFHVGMAYAILRSNGVDLGKSDYLGAMPFREPTAR